MPIGFGTMMNLISMQTSCISGSFMFSKTRLKTMHSNILNKRKWLFYTMDCINTNGDSIPNFYIFKSKSK